MQKEFFHLCKIVSNGNICSTKFGERHEMIVEILKTTSEMFERVLKCKVVTWKETAKKAEEFRNGQKITVFFTKHKQDIDYKQNPILAVTATKVFKTTKREENMYYITSSGQYDPFSRLIK
jgi:hypothetical protein